MKVLFINSVCGIKSTGRICAELAEEYLKNGHTVKIAYGREDVLDKYKKYAVKISSPLNVKLHGLKSRLFDKHGFSSRLATKNFLKWLDEYNPDLIWLHNLHGYYINIEMLFKWIKSRPNLEVKWTLHDCWAFTGHCSHFSVANCDKWQTGCKKCPQKTKYPKSLFIDNSKNNYLRKKKAFLGVKNLTIITPSNWLKDLVQKSFLGCYPIEVEYNKIDVTAFKKTPSDFIKNYGLQDKFIVLGVASVWTKEKGLNDFIKLSAMLDDNYKIVLVGLNKKQIKKAPKNILCVEKTNSKEELAKIYTASNLFINPSKEETFGLTTVEALSCGTQAIVYKNTACEEIVNLKGGIAVNDFNGLYLAIVNEYKKFKKGLK